jgi:succinyl-diaminopimelate desuccinylase
VTDGVMIGYPGNDRLVIGSRGFFRATIAVHGIASHSGARRTSGANAVERAARLVGMLASEPLPDGTGTEFGLSPRLTVTAISGGEGFSIVPDRSTISVDVRLTPEFDATAAHAMLQTTAGRLDDLWPAGSPTTIECVGQSWPPYRLSPDSRIVTALRDAAAGVTGRTLEVVVCGPSNIGNFLATLGVDATAGFGVAYRDAHATDERIDLSTVPEVFAVYAGAVAELLALSSSSPLDPITAARPH